MGRSPTPGSTGLLPVTSVSWLDNGLIAWILSSTRVAHTATFPSTWNIPVALKQFMSVPHDAPGLGAHLEAIADRYPAEPVERAALRFCESVARWRGKPELETYKKSANGPASSPGPSIPIDQLINIPPSATPKPPIERYFHLPTLPTPSRSTPTPTNSKRPRAHDEHGAGDREAKKVNVASGSGLGYVEEEEWVGPYGL
ncbi:hypothetical protein RhiJN_03037 [Ceratobasidium sp. AG-Ba]|nr:hypothetical protein RhiJN_03037 [Ceratobasidium sp. AG-Ba]QRW03925.1 hypothetical protein RhiLY_02924 [Ceratobasidium sp. AG-Ba]